MFGLIGPFEPPGNDINTTLLTCFCLMVAVVNIRSLKQGDAEKPGAKAARVDVNLVSFAGMALSYAVAYQSGAISGSFGQFWIVFHIVQTLVHFRLENEFVGMHQTTFDNMFKGTTNALDTVNSFMFLVYGAMMYLSVGLNLQFLHGTTISLMTLFGTLGPSPPSFISDASTCFGGAAALAAGVLNLPAFSGAEDKDYGEVRRVASTFFWVASIIGMANTPQSGTFYSVWTTVALVMALLLTAGSKESEGDRTKKD